MLVFKQKEAKVRCDCGEEISVNTQDFDLETSLSLFRQMSTLRVFATIATHPFLITLSLLGMLQV